MVSVGTQWDDHVIPLLPVAYSNTAGFQMTTGMATNSTLKMNVCPDRQSGTNFKHPNLNFK